MSDTPPPITVRRATPRDLDEVTAVFAAAVWDEAVAAWMLPDEERRRAWGHATAFRRYLGAQIDDGALVVAGGAQIAGVSVWSRVDGSDPDDDQGELMTTVRTIYGPYVDRFVTVMTATAHAHPSEYPYLYLAQMAVLPRHRGRGLGKRDAAPRSPDRGRGRPRHLPRGEYDSQPRALRPPRVRRLRSPDPAARQRAQPATHAARASLSRGSPDAPANHPHFSANWSLDT